MTNYVIFSSGFFKYYIEKKTVNSFSTGFEAGLSYKFYFSIKMSPRLITRLRENFIKISETAARLNRKQNVVTNFLEGLDNKAEWQKAVD